MPVILTQEVEGLLVGATYTGADEAYLLASGYAKQAAYTGPGVANTGPADCAVADNREFNPIAHNLAVNSGLPRTSENGEIELAATPGDNPQVAYTGPQF